jgi:cation transport regulator ChaB
MPARNEMPSTIQRSPKRAQDTWAKAHDSAVETYGEGERAHRTAYAALKHTFEKVGDHWEPKGHKGPSDPQPPGGRRDRSAPTAGGWTRTPPRSTCWEWPGGWTCPAGRG